jgi:multidrug efflux pump subunit AcrA (membrane-fusion protein)
MEKWALLMFLLILLLIIAGAWFIRYPEVVDASATLTAENAPKEIVTRQEGKLVRLFLNNDQDARQGQDIGWIESTADHREVLSLSSSLDNGEYLLVTNHTEAVSSLFGDEFHSLGELQPAYQQFITALRQFNDYLINGYFYKRKRMLFDDLAYLLKMHQTIQAQEALAQKDLGLAQESYDASDSLYRENVISRQDLRDQSGKLVAKEGILPQLVAALLTNENAQISKQKDIDELEHAISQQKAIFQQALQTLKSLTDDWKKKYIVSAPVAGKVVFIVPLQENQYMQTGKTIGYINPPDSRYYAQVILPQDNFGKIHTGQEVQLRFDGYPYQEFGYLRCKLNYISTVPSDSGFLATLDLPNPLMTNYHRTLQYRSGLKAQALIITKDLRLINRLFYNFAKGASVK